MSEMLDFPPYPCDRCGEGQVRTNTEYGHKVELAGVEITMEAALVGRCDKCGVVHYAFRKDAIKE